jgi:ABC-type phosphate transport system substrate-binding protein
MQSHSKWIIGIVSLVALFQIRPSIADVYVICNSGLDVSEADIKDVFTGEKQSIGGNKLAVVDNKGVEDEFLSKALGQPKAKYDAVWAKKAFREGVAIPSALSGDSDVLSHVKSNPGGIGYVATSPSGVKVIKKY